MRRIRISTTMGSSSRSVRVVGHGRDNDRDNRKERKREGASG